MKFEAVRFKPKGPFHLGIREDFPESCDYLIHSDTLFSAICNSYLLLYGERELEELIEKFKYEKPPFLISSVFFYKDTYFFPVPLSYIPQDKEHKKIKWISLNDLEKLLKNPEEFEFSQKVKEEQFFRFLYYPRVSLSRVNLSTGKNFFISSDVYYSEEIELFFLIKWYDESYRKKIYSAINLLSDEGIGGDRSVGKGLFHKPSIHPLEIKTPDDFNAIYSISLYFPKREEVSDIKKGFYKLIERRGYIYSKGGVPYRRRTVRMFIEGSVFPASYERKGKIIDTTPEIFKRHKIYRYGLIFGLGCKIGEEDGSL